MVIKRVNIRQADKLFTLYEPLVVSIAHRICNKLYFLPEHIREEFIHEARYSLIKTINGYNKKYFNSHRKPVSLKTEITWKCYDHISDWWSRTFCGAKKWVTQKKHKIWPISKEDLEDSVREQWEINSIDPENTAVENIIDKEERNISRNLIEQYRKRLSMNHETFDCLIMTATEYSVKYPGRLNKKQIDNTHQDVRRKVLELIREDTEVRE